MSQEEVFSYLRDVKKRYPALSARIAQCEDLWRKRLYHQLTTIVDSVVRDPALRGGLREFYSRFLRDFESKINPKKFMEFALLISKEYEAPGEAVAFLEKAGRSVRGSEAFVLPLTEIATLKLGQGEVQSCRDLLDEASLLLDDLAETDAVLHGAFYKASARCFQQRGMKSEFFKNGLLFLACTNLAELEPAEQARLAFDLGLAALLSDTIYNFGELLVHPVLASLDGTPRDWMAPVLRAFNAGKVEEYKGLMKKFAAQVAGVVELKSAEDFLSNKISLMCLVEMLFVRPPQERATVSFADISKETKLPKDQVEHLVMKALSLGLIRGVINEVDEQVSVTWVQHRYLDQGQLRQMTSRLEEWSLSAEQTLMLLEQEKQGL